MRPLFVNGLAAKRAAAIDCPPRRNGSTPAALELKRNTLRATAKPASRITPTCPTPRCGGCSSSCAMPTNSAIPCPGTMATLSPPPWASSCRMRGACTCKATHRSGAPTGWESSTTRTLPSTTRPGRRAARRASSAAAIGATTPSPAAPVSAAPKCSPTAAPTSSASAWRARLDQRACERRPTNCVSSPVWWAGAA